MNIAALSIHRVNANVQTPSKMPNLLLTQKLINSGIAKLFKMGNRTKRPAFSDIKESKAGKGITDEQLSRVEDKLE